MSVEWITVDGADVESASIDALSLLGVSAEDADIAVVAPARSGVFGLGARPARVVARVRPKRPPARIERDRSRQQRRPKGRRRGNNRKQTPKEQQNPTKSGAKASGSAAEKPSQKAAGGRRNRRKKPAGAGTSTQPAEQAQPARRRSEGGERSGNGKHAGRAAASGRQTEKQTANDTAKEAPGSGHDQTVKNQPAQPAPSESQEGTTRTRRLS